MQAIGDLARRYALRALDAMAAADPEFDVAVAPSAGTAEGVLEIQVAQIRGAAEKFASSVIPNGRTATRTGPLDALIIGGWVCGLSDRDIESLVSEAGAAPDPEEHSEHPGAEGATRRSVVGARARWNCWCCTAAARHVGLSGSARAARLGLRGQFERQGSITVAGVRRLRRPSGRRAPGEVAAAFAMTTSHAISNATIAAVWPSATPVATAGLVARSASGR